MDIEINYRPSQTAAKIKLNQAEGFYAEGGSMIAMSGGVDIETSTHQKNKGGLFSGIKRMLAGENFFLNQYKAKSGGGEVWLAPTLPGDMCHFQLEGQKVVVQSGSFVMCDQNVSLNVGWQGFKNAFSGEGLFWLNLEGKGDVVFNSFGYIYEIDVTDEYIVDSGHIVAFEETLDFKISKAGSSWVHSILGGEGLVCRFQGRGKLWCQSHNSSSFGHTLGPKLRPRPA
tara:strand:+ start:4478 stop:5161 length:684 start_codon:yes stop_codon:yes gene_type:complete